MKLTNSLEDDAVSSQGRPALSHEKGLHIPEGVRKRTFNRNFALTADGTPGKNKKNPHASEEAPTCIGSA